MPAKKSISLHIGLDSVDPDQYEGWNGALAACEFDAKDMLAIARRQKFAASHCLLTKKATSSAVLAAIGTAAEQLAPGGLFLLTYSGHGGQVPDLNADERDGQDETWLLYDRMLVDDELFAQFARFKTGTRILVFSDSCHSGTVTRMAPAEARVRAPARLMPRKINERVYRAHQHRYDQLQYVTKPAECGGIKATVILISGCQDNQLSLDGPRNGLFTEKLRKVWNGGRFRGSHRRFRDEIAAHLPPTQSPNYSVIGKPWPAFERQTPLCV
ncbi:MAG: caspase family protein [Pirellulaceae bacterium]|nr:caspase family protein [Pirellulaceae bacterium]